MSKTISWREVIRILRENGFKPKKNNHGSHKKYINKKTGKTVIVSAHNLGADCRIGIKRSIFKRAGIKDEDK